MVKIEANEGYIPPSLIDQIDGLVAISGGGLLDDLEVLSEINKGVRAIMCAFPIGGFRVAKGRKVDYERYNRAIYTTLIAVSNSAIPESKEILSRNYMDEDLAGAALKDFIRDPDGSFDALRSRQPGLGHLYDNYESQGFRTRDLFKLKVAIGATHKLAVAGGLTVGQASDTPVVELGRDFRVIGQNLNNDFNLACLPMGLEVGSEQLIRIDWIKHVVSWRRLYFAQAETDRRFIDRTFSGYRTIGIKTPEEAKRASFNDLEGIGLKGAAFTKSVFGNYWVERHRLPILLKDP